MNFKLVENFDDNTREYVQEYLYNAITELGSASLSDYIQWFKDNTDDYDSEIEQALTDAYIEAVDYGTITDVDKTMITSELWSYIDSHEDLLEYDHIALLQQCPQHLQHELKLVLNKLDESLNEERLTETKVAQNDLQRIITYVKEQIALNNAEGITSEHLRSRATDPSHAQLFNRYHSVDIVDALNASDSGLLAILDDADTNNFIVILS